MPVIDTLFEQREMQHLDLLRRQLSERALIIKNLPEKSHLRAGLEYEQQRVRAELMMRAQKLEAYK